MFTHGKSGRRRLALSLIVIAGFASLSLVTLHFIKTSARYAYESHQYQKELKIVDNRLDGVDLSLSVLQDASRRVAQLSRGRVARTLEKTGLQSEHSEAAVALSSAKAREFQWPVDESVWQAAKKPFTTVERVNRTAVRSALTAHKLRSLTDLVGDRQQLLAAIPSIRPVGGVISSLFGTRKSPFTGKDRFHNGLDIAARKGDFVRAAANGRVISTDWGPAFGRNIAIRHGYGIVTKYAHNSRILVSEGDEVRKGEIIAEVGSTGRSTGAHLHYEVWVDGDPVDPMRFLLDERTPAWTTEEPLRLASADHSTGASLHSLPSASEAGVQGGIGGESDPVVQPHEKFSSQPVLAELLKWETQVNRVMLAAILILSGVALYLFAPLSSGESKKRS